MRRGGGMDWKPHSRIGRQDSDTEAGTQSGLGTTALGMSAIVPGSDADSSSVCVCARACVYVCVCDKHTSGCGGCSISASLGLFACVCISVSWQRH